MEASEEVVDADVVPLLNPVSKAIRMGEMKLMDSGFGDKVSANKERKKKHKRRLLRDLKSDSASGPSESAESAV
jgi:hypothetical protein